MFGGGINHEFSEAEETCIMIDFDEINQDKLERHVDSFINEKMGLMKKRFPVFVENMGGKLKEMIMQKREVIQARRAANISRRKARRAKRKNRQ